MSYIYPPEQKQQIVSDLEGGIIGISEAIKRYSIVLPTLKLWVKAYGKKGVFPSTMTKYSRQEKLKILNELGSGKLTLSEAEGRYKVAQSTLYLWRKQYSDEITCTQAPGKMNQHRQLTCSTQEGRTIEDLKLKIAALEMMIDEAEREFNIPIRKKSGSKQ